MPKPRTKPAIAPSTGSLTHNPFARLVGTAAPASPLPAAPPPVEPLPVADPSPPEGPPAHADPAAIRFPAKVVVRRETKGRAGKTVTRITGLPDAHRAWLAQAMRRALGCGGTVEGADVVLLGSLVDRAADWLEATGAKRVVRSG